MGHFTEVFGRGDGPLYCWPLQVEMDDAFSFVSPCDWVDAPRSFALPPRIQNLAVRQAWQFTGLHTKFECGLKW